MLRLRLNAWLKICRFLLNGIDNCPPDDAVPRERVGFRFVFDPIDSRSFEIPAERDTDRFASTPTCRQCGLSMFLTADLARSFFRRKSRKHKKFGELLGDHLAKIALTIDHGVQTDADEDGHFAFYEYEGADLALVTVMVGPLP
jgi:hypothetical protein